MRNKVLSVLLGCLLGFGVATAIVWAQGTGSLGTGDQTIDIIEATTSFVPDAAEGANLGSATLEFDQLFLGNDPIAIRLGLAQDTTLGWGGANLLELGASDGFVPATADAGASDLGSASREWNQIFLGQSGTSIVFGTAQDISLGRSTATALQLSSGDSFITAGSGTADLGGVNNEWRDLYVGNTVTGGRVLFGVGQEVVARWDLTDFDIDVPTDSSVLIDIGTVTNPGLAWDDDEDTGLFSTAANELAVSIAGAQEARVADYGLVLTELAGTDTFVDADVANDSEIVIFSEADCLVFGYDNGGTPTFIKIGLDGSDTTITHDTTDPTTGC